MKRTLGTSLILVTGALSTITPISPGQTPCVDPIPLIDETVKIMATPLSIQMEGDRYGTSVGVSGDYAISGGIQQIPNPLQRGFAIVHYRHQGGLDQWGQIKRLTASDPPQSEDDGDQFGISCGISGDFIIVGSHLDDPGVIPIDKAGSAYIFHRHAGGTDNWGQTAQLIAPDAAPDDRFGFSVAIDGNLAIVGAHFNDDAGSKTGSVYIYRHDGNGTWNFEKKFSGLAAGDEMGFSVDIAQDLSGAGLDLAVAGAPLNDNERAVDAGAAYVFRHEGAVWALEATLIAPELADPLFEENFLEAQFGTDVACWRAPTPSKIGDLVVAGAPLHDLCGVDAADWGCLCDSGPVGGNHFNNGAAYVFQRISDQGTPQLAWDNGFMLVPLWCQSPSLIGRAVDIEDTQVIFTSLLADANNPNIDNRAHLYERTGSANTWSEKLTLYPVAVESSHDFGNSIALSGGTVIVGAHIDGTTSEGRSYVYNGMGDCDGNGVIDALEICSIPSLDSNTNDILDVCEDCNNNDIYPDSDEILTDPTLDCNSNFILDSCDIASGFSLDCDGNGVVDECDPDCNNNGNSDGCDIANGFALDCNLNGIPDRCEVKACRADIMPLCMVQPATPDVNIDDLVAVLNAFGDCVGCPEDFMPKDDLPVGDGVVDIDELVDVLNNFGPCAPGGSGATAITLVQMDFSSGYVLADGSVDAASASLVASAWANTSSNWDVYRLFAQVSGPSAFLSYCGGSTTGGPGGTPQPLVLNPGKGGQFYIPLAGSYAPPNLAMLAIDGGTGFELQQAAFGSYIAMGEAFGAGPSKMGDTAALDNILTTFVNDPNTGWGVYGAVAGQGVVSDGNGGWRVLIGQFAVSKGKTFTAAVRLAGDGIDVYATVNSGVTTLP